MSTRRPTTRRSVGRTVAPSSSAAPASSRKSRRAHDSAMDSDAESQSQAVNEEEGEQQQAALAATTTPVARTRAALLTAPAASASSPDCLLDVSDGEVDDTPTRLSRLDEKSELQGLNKRLEFYILKQRERDASADAWVREVTNLKNKHSNDLEQQRTLFENQLTLVRKNRDELADRLSKAEGEAAQLEHTQHTQQQREREKC